jgi:hypothetical protein
MLTHYSVVIDRDTDTGENIDIVTITYSSIINNLNKQNTIKMHYSTNFNDYQKPPINLYKVMKLTGSSNKDKDKDNYDIVERPPFLSPDWKNGNFTIDDNNIRYERLTQYEYDKYCFDNSIYNSNYELYKKIKAMVK